MKLNVSYSCETDNSSFLCQTRSTVHARNLKQIITPKNQKFMKTLLLITQDDNGIIQAKSDIFQITVNSPDFFTMLENNVPVNLHPELSSILRKWRREKARELDLSAYIILTNKVLLAISNLSPVTEEDLMSIKGFGFNQLDRFGNEILDIVLQYRKNNPEEYREEEEAPWDSSEL